MTGVALPTITAIRVDTNETIEVFQTENGRWQTFGDVLIVGDLIPGDPPIFVPDTISPVPTPSPDPVPTPEPTPTPTPTDPNVPTPTPTPIGDNLAPIAVDDQVTAVAGQTVIFNVLENDIDPDNNSGEGTTTQTLSISQFGSAVNGNLEVNRDSGVFVYQANLDFSGLEVIPYTASDGQTTSNLANVFITVLPSNVITVEGAGFGTDGDDSILGSQTTADSINGLGGSDTIFGQGGADILSGNEGDDLLFGNQDNDTLAGNQGNDCLYGGQNADLILGQEGNDQAYGNKGEDTLFGSEGQDCLYGGQGSDCLRGGIDSDRLFGDKDSDVLLGDAGNDSVYGGEGEDFIFGNEGSDSLLGDAGADTIYGGTGSDSLLGGDDVDQLSGEVGDDFIFGGLGADTLTGGSGSDTFVVAEGTGGPSIEDADIVVDLKSVLTASAWQTV
ncbi:MAG: hypothetical protein HC825_08460 [Oscillatoriales cyanobacterium RM1_1_9]|nr:hypothetical protein [Oscillatoriales cyanobacterium RM1_1_9]